MTFEELLSVPAYSLAQPDKDRVLTAQLNALTELHAVRCEPYGRVLRGLGKTTAASSPGDVPFLPVGVFKTHRLASVPKEEQFRTLTSSGTTGQQVSQIVLDAETARRQTVALSRIMTQVLGPKRLPMILVDSPALLKDRAKMGARAAGVAGMMNFGRQHHYALDEEMRLNERGLLEYLEKFPEGPILIFGFTFMVWQYLLAPLRGRGVDLSRGILIHSGGWKKLQEQAVDNAEFKRQFAAETGLTRSYNFYGMVEQVGSVFLEGEDGYLYPPAFADVIVRDPITFEELPIGETGLIQVISVLPLSYPGHSLLTEDLGTIHHVDGPTSERRGKAFTVKGRLPRAELRGCSDTHAAGRA